MSLYRKKNSPFWHYDFILHGRRFFGSTKTNRRRDAEAIVARIRHDALLPARERPPITLDEAAGLYATHAETLPSWPTIEYMIAALVDGLGRANLLAEITQRNLMDYFARRRSGRSNASVNREIENARAIWRRAAKARYDVGEMPDWGALFLKVPKQKMAELQPGRDETTLIAAIRPDVRDAVDFLLKSGWRRNEVIGLKWADVNLGQRMAWTKIKGGDWVERPLTTEMVVIIARQPRGLDTVFGYVCQKTRTETHKAADGTTTRTRRMAGHLYPLTATVLRETYDAARTAAGLPDLRLHDLRHTRASRTLRATQNLAATQGVMAHRSLKTTLRYAHVLADDIRRALEASDRPAAAQAEPEPQPDTGQTDERRIA